MQLEKINAVRGTKDIYGENIKIWHKIEDEIKKLAYSFSLHEIRTPILEYTDVFKRAIGKETDIVSKEMFEIERKSRNLCLRPENTAGVVRSVVEHSLHREGPKRFFYIGPMFRAERPQKGRYRQFHQLGIEIFGDKSVYADFDVIYFNVRLLEILGIDNYSLKINSVGCPECKPEYIEKLKEFYKDKKQNMCENCQTRYDSNVMRILDCKNETCKTINNSAPSILDSLCENCSNHLKSLEAMLGNVAVKFEIDTSIVRGLDYYSKTAFEIQLSQLGAQSAVCGGGRYDKLVSYFSPKLDVPAVGAAIGIERLIMAIEAKKSYVAEPNFLDYYIVVDASVDKAGLVLIMLEIRNRGYSCLMNNGSKNVGKQFKEASKNNAKNVLIFGEEEINNGTISIKNMKEGSQKTLDLESFFNSLEGKNI